MSVSERQKEIIDAALALIHEQGIQELTMKRIAAAVGVSEPALYRHFASKAEILSAIVSDMEAARSRALDSSGNGGRGADAALASFFDVHARQFAERPALAAVLFSEDVFRNDPGLSARVAVIISGTLGAVAREVERGKAAGVFRRDADPRNLALMLIGGFRLLVTSWRLEGSSFDLVERTRAYLVSAMLLFMA